MMQAQLSEKEMRRAVKNGILDALRERDKTTLGFLFDLMALIAKHNGYTLSLTPQYASVKERLQENSSE